MRSTDNDLIFNVAQLMKDPVGSTRKLEIATPTLELSDGSAENGGVPVEASDVQGQVKVTKLSHDLLVQGEVGAQVGVQCSRCLDDVTVSVEGKLEERFQPTVDVETGRPVRPEEDDEDDTVFDISPNHEMDLTEPVRQALLVALPLKPLCREDCKGLCPQCGANWNNGPCDCPTETIDNRWAGLRDIKLEDLPAGDSNLN
jgi:uncharacterized protein